MKEAHKGLSKIMRIAERSIPINNGKNRALDCAVINYIHQSNDADSKEAYDSIRCAFPEGDAAFEGSFITSRLHIQLCVRNADLIKGYFLPKPIGKFNPNL